MSTKLEELSIIKDEMLMNPNVNARMVLAASKLAEDDRYLYELLLDYMKVVDEDIKKMLFDDAMNYTEETIRTMKLRNEL